MLINIDPELLIKTGLSPNQFLIASLLAHKHFNTIEEIIRKSEISSTELDLDIGKLVSKGFITSKNKVGEYDFSKITVKPSFTQIVFKEDPFEELLLNYPKFTIRPDGSKDFLQVDLPSAKKLYNSLVKKDKVLHEHIQRCLRFEVSLRQKEGTMKYMKRLLKWLAAEEWKSYEHRMKEINFMSTSAEAENVGYGTKLE